MKRISIAILSVFVSGCGSCHQPLHDQCGIHTADWHPTETQMVIVDDGEIETMIAELPPIEMIGVENKENAGDVAVCGEDCVTRLR